MEERLSEGQNNLCKLITITGQTKSGKTVLTKKVYPKANSVWVDGGSIKSEEEFWQTVINQLEFFQTSTVSNSEENSGGSTIDEEYKGNLGFASGGKKYTTSEATKKTNSFTQTKTINSKIAAIRRLLEVHTPIIIDDFHYIERDLQGTLVRALKAPVFEGVPIIIIAIPHRRYDAMKVEKEMTGRISQIAIPIWDTIELKIIAEKRILIIRS